MSQSKFLFDEDDRVVLAGILALFIGAVAYGVVYDNLPLAFVLGLILLGASLGVAALSRGGRLSRTALPVLGMAMTALLIHVGRGHTEAHFAVFAFLACLVAYRTYAPILIGAATIAVHHLSFNLLQEWGWGPMCFTEPGFMRVIEHAVYVVIESAVLLLLARRARAEFRAANELIAIAGQLQSADGSVNLAITAQEGQSASGRQMIAALRHIDQSIKRVQQVAESVREASNEIIRGNQSLNSRTVDASSSIAQTAAAVEQILSVIQASAGHAHEANALAGNASGVAEQGGAAVHQVVRTMGDIQQSSRKITDIIGVIDGIAFQTNILALNAAVEAARAGEQGRGFAVVAGEVRTLAQRSAEAAREVKQLITSSVAQVDSGSSLVNNTGRIIGDVVDQVRRVSALMQHISHSSSEQGKGMHQINESIAHLDEVTQQNAELVDRTAHAAEHLRQQADELMAAVAVFSGNTSGPNLQAGLNGHPC